MATTNRPIMAIGAGRIGLPVALQTGSPKCNCRRTGSVGRKFANLLSVPFDAGQRARGANGSGQLQPLVLPQVSHFSQVPLRTMVKFWHSEHMLPV